MRVGLFADKLVRPVATGVGAYISFLCESLARQSNGHDLGIFSTGSRARHPDESVYGVRLQSMATPRKLVHASWTLAERPYLERFVDGFDLVHVLVPSVPVPTRSPQVMTLHDLTPIRFGGFYSARDRFLFRRAIKSAVRSASAFIAISDATRRDAVELLGVEPERISVVHYGLPPGLGPASSDEVDRVRRRYGLASPFVLFLGQVTVRKNVMALLEAWRDVRFRLPDHRLALVGGPGVGYSDVLQRVRDWKLTESVVLAGRADRSEIPALLTGASAFVLPSHYEGFGLPPLEAMACGTPVVVSDGGALPEVVGDAGLVVPGGSADGIAESLVQVVQDTALAEDLSRRGSARAGRFSWEAAAEGTLSVYERVARECALAA